MIITFRVSLSTGFWVIYLAVDRAYPSSRASPFSVYFLELRARSSIFGAGLLELPDVANVCGLNTPASLKRLAEGLGNIDAQFL